MVKRFPSSGQDSRNSLGRKDGTHHPLRPPAERAENRGRQSADRVHPLRTRQEVPPCLGPNQGKLNRAFQQGGHRTGGRPLLLEQRMLSQPLFPKRSARRTLPYGYLRVTREKPKMKNLSFPLLFWCLAITLQGSEKPSVIILLPMISDGRTWAFQIKTFVRRISINWPRMASVSPTDKYPPLHGPA